MTPVTVETQVQRTTRRTVKLTSGQVENIVKRWAIANHGFTNAADVESYASFDGVFDGMALSETTTSFDDDTDTPIEGD